MRFGSILVVVALAFVAWALILRTVPRPKELTLELVEDRFARFLAPKLFETAQNKEKPQPLPKTPPQKSIQELPTQAEKKEAAPVTNDQIQDAPRALVRNQKIVEKVAKSGVLKVLGSFGKNNHRAVDEVFKAPGKEALNDDLDKALSSRAAKRGLAANSEMPAQAERKPRAEMADGQALQPSRAAAPNGAPADIQLAEKEEQKVTANIQAAPPKMEGSLDQMALTRVVKSRMTLLKECYERELKRDPRLKGKIVVRFTVNESGTVEDLSIEENTLGSEGVAQCMIQRMSRFRFPPAEGGGSTVSYPFVFTPSS